jgi:hypothetical protein
VYLQAEKNLNELVKASHSNSVGGDQSYTIGGNQKFEVKGNQVNTVIGTRAVHVGAMQHMTQKGFTSHADNDHAFTSENATFSLGKTSVSPRTSRASLVISALRVITPITIIEGASAFIKQAESAWLEGGKSRLRLSAGTAPQQWCRRLHLLVGGLLEIKATGVVVERRPWCWMQRAMSCSRAAPRSTARRLRSLQRLRGAGMFVDNRSQYRISAMAVPHGDTHTVGFVQRSASPTR